jgi:hypothetical protein
MSASRNITESPEYLLVTVKRDELRLNQLNPLDQLDLTDFGVKDYVRRTSEGADSCTISCVL